MSILEKVKSYFSRFSKNKQVKKKPTVKVVKRGVANGLVFGGLVLILFIGLFGSLSSMNMSSRVADLQDQVKNFKKQVETAPKNQATLDVPRIRQYMSNFIRVYINYSSDKISDRNRDLENFYSFDSAKVKDTVTGTRTLLGQGLISVEEKEDFKIAQIKVNYQFEQSGQKQERIAVLAVPFQMENGLLAVIAPPYFMAEDNFQGKAEGLEMLPVDQVSRLNDSETSSLKEFLKVFFEKYALSNEQDLSLLMKTPVLMGGGFKVSAINDGIALFYEVNNKKMVQVSVDFEEIESGNVHTEDFTLILSEQSSGWYVEELYNYFKN